MNKNILYIIESISNEKSLDKNIIFNILEKSLEIAIKKKNNDLDIKVIFNRNSGKISIFKLLKIVNNVSNPKKEISLKDINLLNNKKNINDYIEEEINEFKFDRILSKITKQIIFNKIKEIEKKSLIQSFNKLIGEIFIGKIEKIYKDKIILNIGYEFEAILNKNHMLINDVYEIGKKMKFILYNLKYSTYGLQFLMSRSHIAMLTKLIIDNIYEFKKNIFKIKYISRYPGIKTKIIFETFNKSIKMSNINKNIFNKLNIISNELNGECIDIIIWDNNLKKFISNIIFPIKIISINISEKDIYILIKKKDLNFILGKNNINLKLIYKLFDKYIHINTLN